MRSPLRGLLDRVFGNQGDQDSQATDPFIDGDTCSEVEQSLETSWTTGDTNIGRKRENNEDNYLCDSERRVFIVADGMGGHLGGEKASAAVVAALRVFFSDNANPADSDSMSDFLFRAVDTANNAITQAVEDGSGIEGMGSTVVIGLLQGSMLHVTNVGDSRVYLIRDGQHQLISRDHSVAAAFVEHGEFTPEEARNHPYRNQLTQCLGGGMDLDPHYAGLQLQEGDRILLCSDGLWDMLSDEEITCFISSADHPKMTVASLIHAANEAGGHDNITAVVLFITSEVLNSGNVSGQEPVDQKINDIGEHEERLQS